MFLFTDIYWIPCSSDCASDPASLNGIGGGQGNDWIGRGITHSGDVVSGKIFAGGPTFSTRYNLMDFDDRQFQVLKNLIPLNIKKKEKDKHNAKPNNYYTSTSILIKIHICRHKIYT